MERRIAAILAADMVGFSRLIEADEAGTLKAHKQYLDTIFDPVIARHNGRIVKLLGDGLLAVFDSVVEAVRASVDIQRNMSITGTGEPPEHSIRYRMAVNLGDVVFEDGDILGDGVNIAARLEPLADPGGIVVSGTAYDHLKSQLDVGYDFLGEKRLKNIATPVRIYRILLDQSAPNAPPRKRLSRIMSAVALVVALIAVVLIGQQIIGPDRYETAQAAPALPDIPSIAVLPFENQSFDPDQEWIADGITADLTTGISKLSGIFVVARNSSFVYKDQRVDAKEIGRRLGVHYLLTGSVQRSGDEIRVRAGLVDAQTGRNLWLERFDEDSTDVFAVQDRVTERVVQALSVALTPAEQATIGSEQTTSGAAYEAFLRGREHLRNDTQDDLAKAFNLLELAVELDPEYSHAHAALAQVFYRAFERGWSREVLGMGWNVARLRTGKHMTIARKNPSPLFYRVNAEIFLRVGRTDEAHALAQNALDLDPNDPENQIAVARTLIYLGRSEEALALIEAALRRDPLNPAHYLYLRGLAHFVSKDYETARTDFQDALSTNAANHRINALLAATLGYLKELGSARDQFEYYKKRERDDGHKTGMTRQAVWLRWPFKQQEDWDHLARGLALAAGKELRSNVTLGLDAMNQDNFFEYMMAD
jgi:adenylate cyclase